MNTATVFKSALAAPLRATSVHELPWSRRNSFLIYLSVLLSMGCVLVADLYTPLGVAVWIGFLLPVTLSLTLWNPQAPLATSAVATLLMILTFVTDAPGIEYDLARLNRVLGIFTIWTMAIVGYFFIRNRLAVYHQQWLQAARTGLGEVMSGEQSIEEFGAHVVGFLAEYLRAHAGVMYMRTDSSFRRIATYGIAAGARVPETFMPGDGLPGQAVADERCFVVSGVLDGYLQVGSTLGQAQPRSVVVFPVKSEGVITTVLEFGFLHEVDAREEELLQDIAEALGKGLRSVEYRRHLQILLEETQRQAEELQLQSEELRVSNEELAEQGQALQQSHEHLEHQQTVLEQSNAQLEEQTQLLEHQRDELAHARSAMELKAHELERVSQYKSDFLANMSHELRTPLNSALILAQLLADNAQQNLTPEQVAAAQTIMAAGNDLLTLINDILDLSRIEAGRLEIHSEPVWLAQLGRNLINSMKPQADQKSLDFVVQLADDCPETIGTDYQRLEQVLKNLLSNAIKFTEEGSVVLGIGSAPNGGVAFTVTDTGIGIPKDQQQRIFEAFHQVDSTANRRYNGTGLGLSISRELTRLLGGEISLNSVPGKGSTFTLVVPLNWDPPLLSRQPDRRAGVVREAPAVYSAQRLERRKRPHDALAQRTRRVRDDRERLSGNNRVILVVEDDETFAAILCELVHELDFQCLIAVTADEAVAVAHRYLPSGVILDVVLPDHSGLTVLDRLKEDPRTRHIPVHVISGSDYSEAAFALGAIGYMSKPATREMLIDALRGLESRLAQSMRRVLLVEDDAAQLDELRKMLDDQGVQTVGASSAEACLEQLRTTTFDCMVVDLSLPAAGGYALLDMLSEEERYPFPPVIVYTGQELNEEEAQRLRSYSRSIVVKGAKSPERLLDEVTLFLHQVVAELPPEQQRMIQKARNRESVLENRRILIVEDDVRNVFALVSILEPWGAVVQIARNGREALDVLGRAGDDPALALDLVLMDVMMPEMDGITATREIRKQPRHKDLPIIMLTAKAMPDDQQACIAAGANDYMPKPLDVDKLLSLIRVWLRR